MSGQIRAGHSLGQLVLELAQANRGGPFLGAGSQGGSKAVGLFLESDGAQIVEHLLYPIFALLRFDHFEQLLDQRDSPHQAIDFDQRGRPWTLSTSILELGNFVQIFLNRWRWGRGRSSGSPGASTMRHAKPTLIISPVCTQS